MNNSFVKTLNGNNMDYQEKLFDELTAYLPKWAVIIGLYLIVLTFAIIGSMYFIEHFYGESPIFLFITSCILALLTMLYVAICVSIAIFKSKSAKHKYKGQISVVLNSRDRSISKLWDHMKYSFFREEFINPRIIYDLQGWVSDSGDQVVAVNLLRSNKSNRYYNKEIEVKALENSKYPYVYYEDEEDSNGRKCLSSFGYQYIGSSNSGIHVLRTSDWGGGSGIFENLIFIVIETDEQIRYEYNDTQIVKEERINLQTLGHISLGDRYDGELLIKDGYLKIGKNVGWFSDRYKSKDKYIKLQ